MRPGDYCINCRALEAVHGGPDTYVAVDCGNHVWGNTYDESLAKKEREVAALWLAKRLRECGFAEVVSNDVTIYEDNHQFRFAWERDLRWGQLRKLSGEFRTDRIHWTEDSYEDSGGEHSTGYVTVGVPEGIRQGFPVTDPDSDAPDGAVLMLEDRGGYFERQLDRWVPVTWKEWLNRERFTEAPADDDWPG